MNMSEKSSLDKAIPADFRSVCVPQVAAGGTSSKARLRWPTAACRLRCARRRPSCTGASFRNVWCTTNINCSLCSRRRRASPPLHQVAPAATQTKVALCVPTSRRRSTHIRNSCLTRNSSFTPRRCSTFPCFNDWFLDVRILLRYFQRLSKITEISNLFGLQNLHLVLFLSCN